MPLLNNEIARRENGRVQLRPGPLRVRWSLDDLVTADGHKLHCAFTCSVSALSEAAERRMLEEVFLGRGHTVTADAVVAHFTPGLRSAAGKLAGQHTAVEWVEQDALRQPMIDALRDKARAIAFSAGVDVLGPFDVSFESPTFKSQKLEEMERTLAERRVAGQVEHFERASRLLKQFNDLRAAAPDLTAADIFKQVSPADQGMMLQTLLLAAGKAQSTACLWAVAGNSLIKIDGRATPATMELVALPATLGPLRSVQPARLEGRDVLLVGARSGIAVFDPQTRVTQQEYADPSIDSQLGFSRAVVWDGQIWGCHGDAGVVAWRSGQTQSPATVIRPIDLRGPNNPPPLPTAPSPATSMMSISTRTNGIRNLTVLDEGRLVLSVGHVLTILNADGHGRSTVAMPTGSEIVGIFADGNRLVVVQDNGTVSLRDRATLEPLAQQRRSGHVTATTLLPWLGSSRLLLATDEGPVYCVGLDDELVTSYLSSHRGIRVIAASADLVAGVSADRQRVVLWNSWDGKKPLAELSVSGAARHRVGDIEFA
ncbi:MAG TPA: hypothetical protein VH475_22950 [Tepidisphaeraceae bacterium]